MSGTTRLHVRLAIAAVAAASAIVVPTASATQLITDTLAPGGTSASASHFVTDTLAPGGGAGGLVSAPAGGGFSWADAGVGAIVVCGVVLLAAAAQQLVARRRRGQLAF